MYRLKWVDGVAFAQYEEWECYKAGFHNVGFNEYHARESKILYQCEHDLLKSVERVLYEWPITVAVHLSQKRNHKAWMGHAACFVAHGAGMQSSIAAYWMLDEAGRELANECVMLGIKEWNQANIENLGRANYQLQNDQLGFRY